MEQTCQGDTRTELSKPGEPGITMSMVEKGIQQHSSLGDAMIYSKNVGDPPSKLLYLKLL